jgi:hypothetical protein
MRRTKLTKNPVVSARAHHMRCARYPSPLDEVVAAIVAATDHETRFYVERGAKGWRWSLVHPGGPYPLLRITARFLDVEHDRILVPCRGLPNGLSVLGDLNPPASAKWTLVDVPKRATASVVVDAISAAFGACPGVL